MKSGKIKTPDETLTADALFNGRLSLVQPAKGYRFSVDALLLADFASVEPGMAVLDLGAGAGVVALALALKLKTGRLTAVEVQPRLAECARRNLGQLDGIGLAWTLLEMNWSSLTPSQLGGHVDYVVSNPPYRRLGAGRINPEAEEAMARHELAGSLSSAAATAARAMKPGGKFAFIYPASRLAGAFADMRESGFEPKRLRLVHSHPGESARLVLVEARLGGGEELLVEPPLFVYSKSRVYSEEADDIISGRRFGEPAA